MDRGLTMLIVIFSLSIAAQFVHAAKHYIHRSHLNETYYGKTRFAVDNFIDHHRMNLLLRMLKKNKHHFYLSPGSCFVLEGHKQEPLFISIIEEQDRKKFELQTFCKNQEERSCYDRALHLLKTNVKHYNTTAALELREELEAYIYIRDKILEYASEVFNTTVVSSMGGDGVVYFYYRPESPTLKKINGREYILLPHTDYYLVRGFYDRPLTYDKPESHLQNIQRRYSATLYFDDIPESSGGVFEWYDFPNNYKLPPEKGHSNRVDETLNGKHLDIHSHYSPSFADPELNITRIQSRKGKLLLFSAQDDIHGVREYSGKKERWALMFALSDEKTMTSIRNGITPQDLLDKEAPIAVVY